MPLVLAAVPVPPPVPAGPVWPAGMVKLRVAAVAVPELVTMAAVPGALVETEPTATVAAAPVGPEGPVAPAAARSAQADGELPGRTPELLAMASQVELV